VTRQAMQLHMRTCGWHAVYGQPLESITSCTRGCIQHTDLSVHTYTWLVTF
jgi:hypothetical protein